MYSQFGNLELRPETSRTYEAGFDLDLIKDQLNVNFSYFKRSIDDVIDFGPLASGRFGYINQNQQDDDGFEAELSFKPNQIFNITAFYAYVDGELTTPAGTDFNLFRRPKNTIGANAGTQLSEKVNVSLMYKWSDSRKDRYWDSSIPPFGATVDADLESYQLLDVYIQYKPRPKITLFTDVKNILDTDYVEFEGYNTRGINFNAGLRVEFR